MKTILRNALAVIIGVVIGSMLNMFLISLSGSLIALPEGVNPEDINSIKENMHLYEPKHFLMPFLAHAFGTLVGASLVAFIAVSRKLILSLLIGALFLLGGIMMVLELPSPIWFNILDLGLAYFPMAWLGFVLAKKVKRNHNDL